MSTARATKRTSDVNVETLGDSGRRRRGRGEDEELGARVKMETFAKDVGASLPPKGANEGEGGRGVREEREKKGGGM